MLSRQKMNIAAITVPMTKGKKFWTFPVQHVSFILDGFSSDHEVWFDADDNIVVHLKDQKKVFVYDQEGDLLRWYDKVAPPPVGSAVSKTGVQAVMSDQHEVSLFK